MWKLNRLAHFLLLVTIALQISPPSIRGDDLRQAPYEATVSVARASVWRDASTESGVSSYLLRSNLVRVFEERPDGWLAIKPPDGSFSWVNAADLKSAGDGLARVSRENTPCYVGSREHNGRDLIHVRLRQDETVQILGESIEVAGDNWFKIAPPAGEFRWIRQADVTPLPNRHTLGASPAEQIASAAHNFQTDSTSHGTRQRFPQSAIRMKNDHPRDHTDPPPSLWSERTQRHSMPVARGIDDELVRLSVDLSKMLVLDPSRWRLDDLRADADRVLAKASTPKQLNRARSLAARIEKLRRLRRRHVASGLSPKRPTTTAGLPQFVAAPFARATAAYDGQGFLTPAVSRKSDAPTHALTDASGEVLYLVTGAPGVNLRRYEGKQVGIQGSRGYIAQFDKRHLTAKQVTPLQKTSLR